MRHEEAGSLFATYAIYGMRGKNKMKRSGWILSLALAACGSVTTISAMPSLADGNGHGGQGQNANEVRQRINLTGNKINGKKPEGHAEFRTRGTRRQLNVEAEKVNLPDGTVLSVAVNGMTIGTIVLKLGASELELNTNNKATVPAIQKGDVVTIVSGDGSTILSGAF